MPLHIPMDLIGLLEKSSSPTSIGALKLNFIWHCVTELFEDSIVSQEAWESLDAVLAGPNYPALKDVAITFEFVFDVFANSESASAEYMTERRSRRAHANFPRLCRREDANVQVNITTNLS